MSLLNLFRGLYAIRCFFSKFMHGQTHFYIYLARDYLNPLLFTADDKHHLKMKRGKQSAEI